MPDWDIFTWLGIILALVILTFGVVFFIIALRFFVRSSIARVRRGQTTLRAEVFDWINTTGAALTFGAGVIAGDIFHMALVSLALSLLGMAWFNLYFFPQYRRLKSIARKQAEEDAHQSPHSGA